MKLKLFEIRDRGTCISALAIKPVMPTVRMTEHIMADEHETERLAQYRHHLSRTGYDGSGVLLGDMNGRKVFNVDPYDWDDRTWRAAHVYIEEHFDSLIDGQVIDVRVILGEATEPAKPDRLYKPGDAS